MPSLVSIQTFRSSATVWTELSLCRSMGRLETQSFGAGISKWHHCWRWRYGGQHTQTPNSQVSGFWFLQFLHRGVRGKFATKLLRPKMWQDDRRPNKHKTYSFVFIRMVFSETLHRWSLKLSTSMRSMRNSIWHASVEAIADHLSVCYRRLETISRGKLELLCTT